MMIHEKQNKRVRTVYLFLSIMTLIFLTSMLPAVNMIYVMRRFVYYIILSLVIMSLLRGGKLIVDKVLFLPVIFSIYCILVSIINRISIDNTSSILYFLLSFVVPWILLRSNEENSYVIVHDSCKFASIIMLLLIPIYFIIGIVSRGTGIHSHFAYIFPILICFVLTNPNKSKYSWILMIAGFVVVTISLKRGAFIGYVLAVVIYYTFGLLIVKQSLSKKVTSILGAIAIAVILVLVFDYFSQTDTVNMLSRLTQIREEGSSSRGLIFEATISAFKRLPLSQRIIGRGFNGVRNDMVFYDLTGTFSAHNDFLEILYDFGYIGIALYSLIILSVLKMIIRLFKNKDPFALGICASFGTFIVQSYVSHLFLYNYLYHWLIYLWLLGYLRIKRFGLEN